MPRDDAGHQEDAASNDAADQYRRSIQKCKAPGKLFHRIWNVGSTSTSVLRLFAM